VLKHATCFAAHNQNSAANQQYLSTDQQQHGDDNSKAKTGPIFRPYVSSQFLQHHSHADSGADVDAVRSGRCWSARRLVLVAPRTTALFYLFHQ